MDEDRLIYDLRGFKCPLVVLKAQKYLLGIKAGEALTILSDDQLASLDLAHFCQKSGYSYQSCQNQNVLYFTIYCQKS